MLKTEVCCTYDETETDLNKNLRQDKYWLKLDFNHSFRGNKFSALPNFPFISCDCISITLILST